MHGLMNSRWARSFFVVSILISGCVQKVGGLPVIHYGKDVCAECRMIIMDKRFASAIQSGSDDILKFDDIGCMILYERKNSIASKYSWVHDYVTGEWLESGKAFFVHSTQLVTPMGHGIAAFSSRGDAMRFLEKQEGQVLPVGAIFNALQKNVKPFKGGNQNEEG